jgi:arginase family enzyme
MELAIAAVDPHHLCALHLSLDIDAVDPVYAPGTGTTASGGLTQREIKYICTELGRTSRLVGMDLVEVNPDLDPSGDGKSPMHGDNPSLASGLSPTVKLAAECVLAALDNDSMR